MFSHNIACYVFLINEEFVELSTKNTYRECINLFEDPNYVNVICKFSINKFVSQICTLWPHDLEFLKVSGSKTNFNSVFTSPRIWITRFVQDD